VLDIQDTTSTVPGPRWGFHVEYGGSSRSETPTLSTHLPTLLQSTQAIPGNHGNLV